MKLACNFSPALKELLDAGSVQVDYIKAGAYGLFLPELPVMLARRPVLLHGLGDHERAGMPGFRALDYGRMNGLLRQCGSPHLAIHLAITNADAAPGMSDDQIFQRMVECTCWFREHLDVPLLVENTGDTPEEHTVYDLIPFVEPERIAAILDQTGAGLLLDVAHAKVTAQYRGWDIRSYLSSLPLRRVKEIHITGTGFLADGSPYDAHGPMEDGDFALLEWALARTNPDVVTLEYGGPAGFDGQQAEPDILRRQLIRMGAILGVARKDDERLTMNSY